MKTFIWILGACGFVSFETITWNVFPHASTWYAVSDFAGALCIGGFSAIVARLWEKSK